MAEGHSCEEFPYFKLKINDMDSRQIFKSPSFTVKGVKFRMVYHHVISSDLYEIYMEPEVGDSVCTIPTYSIPASISIISQHEKCGDLRCTQQSLSINLNTKGNRLHHILWLLRKKEMLNIRDKIVGGNGMNDVTFICVFGQNIHYLKDVFEEEGTWCNKQCFLRLGNDLDKLRLTPDLSILPKADEDEIKADEDEIKADEDEIKANVFILSARSKEFADMVRKQMVTKKNGEKKAVIDIKFECLENFITYLYRGQLKDSKPPFHVLLQLYDTSVTYDVESLTAMVSFKLLEYLNDPIFICSCSSVSQEESYSGIETIVQGLSGGSHIVEKYKFGLGYHADGLKNFANDVLYLLHQANSFEDKTFKEKIMFSIAKDNDFILHTSEWRRFRDEFKSELICEVYRAFFEYVKKYRLRR